MTVRFPLTPPHDGIFNKFDRRVKFHIDGTKIFDDIFLAATETLYG
jgi:hypothetical protein